jgi:hypothetical protein
METTPYYKAFVAQTPEDILQTVSKKDEAILIGISLNNGLYIEGIILDITKNNNHQHAVCMLSQDEQISFFLIHNIAFVSVKQPKKMIVELSKGAISRPMSSKNQELTILQLKRWINNEKALLGNQIKDFNINQVSIETLNNRLNIQDVFAALQGAINRITKDTLGQESWETIEAIQLKQTDSFQLETKAETLIISINIDRVLPKDLTKQLEEKLLLIL